MIVTVNGERRDVCATAPAPRRASRRRRPAATAGVAAAVNGEVVPRARVGRRRPVRDGDRVEVITAVQGG